MSKEKVNAGKVFKPGRQQTALLTYWLDCGAGGDEFTARSVFGKINYLTQHRKSNEIMKYRCRSDYANGVLASTPFA